MSRELLAQLVELLSIGLADRRIQQPVQVPRPDWMNRGTTPGPSPAARNPYTAAIGRLMAVPAPGAAA